MVKIAFHGVPRSGTSWVGAIFDSSKNVAYRHQPLFSYAFKSYLSENSNLKDINNFFQQIKNTDDAFVLQKEGKANGYIPVFEKDKITHIVYKEARYHNILFNLIKKDPEIKIVGIIRNPKSVLSSWYLAPKEFNREKWNLLSEWRTAKSKNAGRKEEYYGYNKWKEVALLFLQLKKEYPNRFFLIEYIDLLNNTTKVVKSLFDFCELDFSEQTIKFINESKTKDLSVDAYSVFRKNQVDDKWKKTLPLEIVRIIDSDLRGTVLEKFNK